MVGIILLGIVFAVLLELNKNMLIGWILLLAVLVGFFFLRKYALADRPWLLWAGGWVALVAVLAAVLVFTQGPYKLRPAVEGKDVGVTPVYTVAQGDLTGVYTADGAVEVFAGIPYAKPPVGQLRWREPQDPEPWQGVLAADTFAPMGMQPSSGAIYDSIAKIVGYHDFTVTLSDNFRDVMSEDSLYVNIWKPADAKPGTPVLVYIHGGSLETGQPWWQDYRGEGLARQGIIVVTVGYRLGVFGFFADEALAAESPNGTTGNYGLLDQIKALEWVRDNIAAFGGDPGNVTVAGESAGSACVTALATSPLAKGLFRRIIAESSTTTAPKPAHSFRSMEAALAAGVATKAQFGAATIDELRAIPADKLVAATATHHHLTVDGYALTESPAVSLAKGISNAESFLHGFNATEGALFTILNNANLKTYEAKVRAYFGDFADEVLALYCPTTDAEAKAMWIELYSAVYFTYGHHCLTRQAIGLGIPAYTYYFTKDNGRLGANHGGELMYFYGNIPGKSRLFDESDRALSAMMQAYLVNFVTTGDPNGPGLPVWTASSAPGEMLELGERVAPTTDRLLALYDILDRMSAA
ncbi:MAG: carboxylesterase family protein [Eggerthellaceae bacterium]|nr:carboxylesterase family protein [Eggerthellaceae bacterium]